MIRDRSGALGGRGGAGAEPDQRGGERLIGMHRDVSGHVVEDVGLGQVLQPRAVTDRDGGRELAPAQAIEEDVRRHVAADCARPEAGERLHELVDLREMRDARRRELQLGHPFEKTPVGVAGPGIVHPLEQPPPGRLVLLGVELVRLIDDVDLAVGAGLLDEGRPGGGQVRRMMPPFWGPRPRLPDHNDKNRARLEAEAARPQPEPRVERALRGGESMYHRAP